MLTIKVLKQTADLSEQMNPWKPRSPPPSPKYEFLRRRFIQWLDMHSSSKSFSTIDIILTQENHGVILVLNRGFTVSHFIVLIDLQLKISLKFIKQYNP